MVSIASRVSFVSHTERKTKHVYLLNRVQRKMSLLLFDVLLMIRVEETRSIFREIPIHSTIGLDISLS